MIKWRICVEIKKNYIEAFDFQILAPKPDRTPLKIIKWPIPRHADRGRQERPFLSSNRPNSWFKLHSFRKVLGDNYQAKNIVYAHSK